MQTNQLKSKELTVTFIDLETTDKNPASAEILTAFARTRRLNDFSIVDEIYLTFKPEKYLYDSYPIHKISEQESDLFDDKWFSFRKLLNYMLKHKDGLFCCHANHLVFGSYGYFDEQVIRSLCLYQSSNTYYWYLKQRFKWISTHTIAKNIIQLDNYRLNNIADHFGFKFNHHDCKSDVEVTEKIFERFINKNTSKEDLLLIGDYKNGINRRYDQQSRTGFSL